MEWLLILTLTFQGQTHTLPTGQMISKQACVVAGAGMVAILERANPGLIVQAACVQGSAA